MWPVPDAGPRQQRVAASDFDALLALRIRAMQPSLQALGRFDPARARERLARTFLAQHMQHIVLGGRRVGCVTLRPKPGALRMDHVCIEHEIQRLGIGSRVMDWACSSAELRQQRLELAALQGSATNRLYRRHDRIAAADELSAPCEKPPARRTPARLAGQRRAALWPQA